MIPTSFECMGFTFQVKKEKVDDTGDHSGAFYGEEGFIKVDPSCRKDLMHQTFWHEYVHCALSTLGYEELNSDEQFVDLMAQCLYQLEKTRK